LESYVGIEINRSLEKPCERMTEFLLGYCDTSFNIIMDDCLNVNCDVLEYDTVLCSPPYYFKEKYENNVKYKTKEEMNDWFYRPIFKRT
jgi:hypothetical protein